MELQSYNYTLFSTYLGDLPWSESCECLTFVMIVIIAANIEICMLSLAS